MSYSAIDVPDFYEAASIRLISLGLADYTGQKRRKQGVVVHNNSTSAAQNGGDVTDNNSNALQVSKAPGSGAL